MSTVSHCNSSKVGQSLPPGLKKLLPLANEVAGGNVFTPVCDSVHTGRCVYPSMQWAGGLCPEEGCVQGVYMSRVCVSRCGCLPGAERAWK